jgi:AcrR family transcriptional regulator
VVQPTVRSDTRRTRKRRIQLLDAALETFVERGYSDVGVAEIVARIGCSHGTFYNYFDNKRDALDALLSRELAELVAVAELHRPRPRTRDEFVAGLGELVGRLLEYATERPHVLTFLAMEAPGIDAAAMDTLAGSYAQLGHLCGQYIRHGIEDGYLRDGLDIEFAGEAVLSCLMGAALPIILDNSAAVDIDATAETVVEFVCYGLRGPNAAGSDATATAR